MSQNSENHARSTQKLAIILIMSIVLLSLRAEARSVGQLASNYEQTDGNPLVQNDDNMPTELVIERALNYAVELNCKNIGDLIMLARSRPAKDSSEFVDLMDNVRLKKAITKHTPRFGR